MNRAVSVVLISFLLSGAAQAEGTRNLSIGAAFVPPVGDLTGSLGVVEYEHGIAETVAIAGRGVKLGYFYDDGAYEEDGDGSLVGVAARWFPNGVGRGFFVGGGLSSFKSTWRWIDDKGTRYRSSGSGETSGLVVNGEVGYRFALGENVSLTPGAILGGWLNATQTCHTSSGADCGDKSQIGAFLFGSLMLGVRF